MSHFTVLVSTKTGSDEELRAVLQPYHEFECTGTEDEYVVDVDETDALRKQWQKGTETRYRSPDGKLHEAYGDEFYRDLTPKEADKIGIGGTGGNGTMSWTSKDWGDGRGYRTKVHFLPVGWEKVQVPSPDVETFRKWVSDYTGRDEVLPGGRSKHGWTEVTSLDPDGEVLRCVDRTNPHKKWDWWTVGGRWSGLLTIKTGGSSDSARRSDVDMASKIAAETKDAGEAWDKAQAILTGRTWLSWDAVVESTSKDYGKAREIYNAQDGLNLLRSNDAYKWHMGLDDFLLDRDTYARRIAMRSAMTFAILHNGEWHEKGEMGWWATVSNEKDREAWEDEWFRVYNSIPEDYTITVVDCHI